MYIHTNIFCKNFKLISKHLTHTQVKISHHFQANMTKDVTIRNLNALTRDPPEPLFLFFDIYWVVAYIVVIVFVLVPIIHLNDLKFIKTINKKKIFF